MLFLETGSGSEIAVHEDTDRVNMFLSSKSQCRSGFPNQISRCAFHRNKKSNARGSRFCSARCFAVSARSNPSWVKYEKSQAHGSVSCCFIFLQNPSCVQHQFSLLFLSWCARCFGVRIASRLMMSGACIKSGSTSKYCPV